MANSRRFKLNIIVFMFSLCLCVLQEATVFAQISAADARNASGLELSFHTATAISDLASACGLKISKHLIQSIREGTLSSNISAEVNKFTQEPDCLKASRQYFIIQNELHYRANYNLLQAQKKAFRLTVQPKKTRSTNERNLEKYKIQTVSVEKNYLLLTGLLPEDAKIVYLAVFHKNSNARIDQFVDLKKNPGQWLKKVYLRSGPGDYEVQLLVKTDLKEQSFLIYDTIKVQSQFSWDPNVLPSHYAESDSPVIINLAKAITKNKKTNTDKAKALYEWVKQNISYDYMTLEKFSKGLSYIDVHGQDVSALYTLQNRIDVCVGYASLYAALLRSINIPTRIIFGDTPQGEHAWNEVFIDNKWLLTDVTWDSPNGNEYFNPTAEFFEKTHHTRKPTLY